MMVHTSHFLMLIFMYLLSDFSYNGVLIDHYTHNLINVFLVKLQNKHKGGNMPAHGATSGPAKDTLDPFTRKTSVKKVIKGQKKQQGSSRFRTKGTQELTPLTLLKGMFLFTFVFCV